LRASLRSTVTDCRLTWHRSRVDPANSSAGFSWLPIAMLGRRVMCLPTAIMMLGRRVMHLPTAMLGRRVLCLPTHCNARPQGSERCEGLKQPTAPLAFRPTSTAPWLQTHRAHCLDGRVSATQDAFAGMQCHSNANDFSFNALAEPLKAGWRPGGPTGCMHMVPACTIAGHSPELFACLPCLSSVPARTIVHPLTHHHNATQ
jgi:hypothetical protein